MDLPYSPNYHVQKMYSHPPRVPTPLLYLHYRFFFKILFIFAIIVNFAMVPFLVAIFDVQRKTRNYYIFKVWTTWGETFSRRHQNKYVFYIYFSALKVSLHFQFGFMFMRPLFCLLSKFINVATLALGLRPKQRGCKGAGQEEAWESHHILPGV